MSLEINRKNGRPFRLSHTTLSPAARELFAMAEKDELQLFIDPVVLGECCLVLGGKAYTEEFPSKQEIADRLSRVLLLIGTFHS